MTTIINSPTPDSSGNNGSGFLIGTLILVGLVALVLYFGIPAVRNMGPIQVNVPAPQINVDTPEVVVPDSVDVTVVPAE
jgi:hypothetical protein